MTKKHIETIDKLFYDKKVTSDITRSVISQLTSYKTQQALPLTASNGEHTTATITARLTQLMKYSYESDDDGTLDGTWDIIYRAALLVRFAHTKSVVDVPLQLTLSVGSAGARAVKVTNVLITSEPKVSHPELDHLNHDSSDDEINTDVYQSRQRFNQYRDALVDVAKSSLTWDTELVTLSRF